MTCGNVNELCVLSFQKLTPIVSMFSDISDDILNDHFDMMSYDLNFFKWESDEDR